MSLPAVILVHDLATGAVRARVHPAEGETLYAAAARSGVPWRTRCRGSTICGQCWVRLAPDAEGIEPPAPDEVELLRAHAPGVEGYRLACRLVLPSGGRRLEVAAPAP